MQLKNIPRWIDSYYQYLALVPLVVVLVVLVFAPVVQLFSTSFTEVRFLSGGLSFKPVGFDNYRSALQDGVALRALLNTAAFAAIPGFLMVLFAQKYVTRGLTLGAIKG